jgi:hypothetical protein
MKADVAKDFEYGRQYLDHLKAIVGRHLVAEAPANEDMTHNTDLIVLRLDAVRIACRVRRESYLSRYGDQFTIRSTRPNGTTELAKIIEGWGDYVLYGFGAENGPRLVRWTLGDLKVFRLWFARETARTGKPPGIAKPNPDGSSHFRAFRYADLPAEFIIASHPLPSPKT